MATGQSQKIGIDLEMCRYLPWERWGLEQWWCKQGARQSSLPNIDPPDSKAVNSWINHILSCQSLINMLRQLQGSGKDEKKNLQFFQWLTITSWPRLLLSRSTKNRLITKTKEIYYHRQDFLNSAFTSSPLSSMASTHATDNSRGRPGQKTLFKYDIINPSQ